MSRTFQSSFSRFSRSAALLGRALLWLAATAGLAHAQQPARPPATDELFFYYKDPRPERLSELLISVQNQQSPWNAYPPLAGMMAVILQRHPDQITPLVPLVTDPKAASALIAAARLAGQPAKIEMLRAKFAGIGLDAKLNSELAGLPDRIENLRIASPTHLDILWGASFAEGDGRFVVPIIDYFANAANASEPVAIDIAKITIEMMGGPKETIKGLKDKYGEARAVQVVYAATALWAIQSNAHQHAFVKQTVAKYIGDHPDTPATKALSAVMGIKNTRT